MACQISPGKAVEPGFKVVSRSSVTKVQVADTVTLFFYITISQNTVELSVPYLGFQRPPAVTHALVAFVNSPKIIRVMLIGVKRIETFPTWQKICWSWFRSEELLRNINRKQFYTPSVEEETTPLQICVLEHLNPGLDLSSKTETSQGQYLSLSRWLNSFKVETVGILPLWESRVGMLQHEQ